MAVAIVMAERGDCVKAGIGSVIVDDRNRIVATGYNGPPGGLDQTCRLDCPRYLQQDVSDDYSRCLTIHAEANALLFCDRRDREGGSIYVSGAMCMSCAKLVANSGLRRAVIRVLNGEEHRRPNDVAEYLIRCGLEVQWEL